MHEHLYSLDNTRNMKVKEMRGMNGMDMEKPDYPMVIHMKECMKTTSVMVMAPTGIIYCSFVC